MLGAAAFLALAMAPAPAPAGATVYYEAHQMEVGAALELKGDGRFLYALDYGAVSESAQGRWWLAGEMIFLTSDRGALATDPERSVALFDREPLAIDGDALLLSRYNRTIRFERQDR